MTDSISREQLLDFFKDCNALQEGHFKLSSGLHSTQYLQCALVYQDPAIGGKITAALADLWREEKIDIVLGPALGGVIVAYELARQLGTRSVFLERVSGAMALRRGFHIPKGTRVLISEDVVTTGRSAREVIEVVENFGAEAVGVTSVVNRAEDVDFGVPFKTLLNIHPPVYDLSECPLCKEGLEIDSPGSRFLK